MRRAKALGLTGVGVSLAVGATLVAGSATTAGAAPAAKQNQQNQQMRPATFGPTVPVPPGQTRFAAATCPANTSLTGGGGQTAGTRTFLIDSVGTGNSWVVGATNTGATASAVRAQAVCATRVF